MPNYTLDLGIPGTVSPVYGGLYNNSNTDTVTVSIGSYSTMPLANPLPSNGVNYVTNGIQIIQPGDYEVTYQAGFTVVTPIATGLSTTISVNGSPVTMSSIFTTTVSTSTTPVVYKSSTIITCADGDIVGIVCTGNGLTLTLLNSIPTILIVKKLN